MLPDVTPPYISTSCRVGDHRGCEELGVVPYCACGCHREPRPEAWRKSDDVEHLEMNRNSRWTES